VDNVSGQGGKAATILLAPGTARTIDLAAGERADGLVFLTSDGQWLDRPVGRIVRRAAPTGSPRTPTRGPGTLITTARYRVPLRNVQEAAPPMRTRARRCRPPERERARGGQDWHDTDPSPPMS